MTNKKLKVFFGQPIILDPIFQALFSQKDAQKLFCMHKGVTPELTTTCHKKGVILNGKGIWTQRAEELSLISRNLAMELESLDIKKIFIKEDVYKNLSKNDRKALKQHFEIEKLDTIFYKIPISNHTIGLLPSDEKTAVITNAKSVLPYIWHFSHLNLDEADKPKIIRLN